MSIENFLAVSSGWIVGMLIAQRPITIEFIVFIIWVILWNYVLKWPFFDEKG